MPRRVDHEQRRRQITDAVCRITVRGGLASASFREVAAEAGVSVRLVQYYFGTKDQLLRVTHQHVAERATRRILSRVAAAGEAPRDRLRALLTSFIPTDEESRDNMLMFVVLYTTSLVDPSLARDEANEMPQALYQAIAGHLRGAKLRRGVDPDREASMLASLVPGLSQGVLAGALTADQATAVIDYALDRCQHAPVRVTNPGDDEG